jgi:hypothetical protein
MYPSYSNVAVDTLGPPLDNSVYEVYAFEGDEVTALNGGSNEVIKIWGVSYIY